MDRNPRLERLQLWSAIVYEGSNKARFYNEKLRFLIAKNPRICPEDKAVMVRILERMENLTARAWFNVAPIHLDMIKGREALASKGKWPLNRRPLPADRVRGETVSISQDDDPSRFDVPDFDQVRAAS